MKLSYYIKKLQEIEKDYPNAIVIYSSDSEGNFFSKVEFAPTIGRFENEEFDTDPLANGDEPNAVCIN